MLIVIEGMDCAGKTTLANKIQSYFSSLPAPIEFKYTHPVPSEGPAGQTEEYMIVGMDALFNSVRSSPGHLGFNIITDRINLISEEIYGPICRGKSMLSRENYKRIHQKFFLLSPKPIIIFCRPELEVVLKNLEMGNVLQMDGVRANQEKLYKAYDRWFADWLRKGIVDSEIFWIYDYTKDLKAEKVLEFIENRMKALQQAQGQHK